MKKAAFTISILFLLFFYSSAQESAIKNFSLKDYIAPDIKYRTLDLGTSLSTNGFTGVSDNSYNGSSFNARLNYYEYVNTKKHQGISNGSFYTLFSYQKTKYDTNKYAHHRNLRFTLDYGTQNRFYKRNKVFIGVHGNFSFAYDPIKDEEGDYLNDYKRNSQRLVFTPYISVGKGRIEPVESARRAMDILISLEKYNRLALSPDSSLIDSLARVANRIRFKRFFDSRFKRIYQLEELDKAIQTLGIVDNPDIVYFANLNDIWNYAPNFDRGSGTRFEGGIIPDFYYYFSEADYENEEYVDKYKGDRLGIFGFFSFNRMRPINYAWQSNLMIDITAGYNRFNSTSEGNMETRTINRSLFRSLLNASWQFGYFPNTRTFAGITPFAGISFDRNYESAENTRGINTGFRFDMYFYVSPRLRLTFEASVTYTENFDLSVPTPFWNTVNYEISSYPENSYDNDHITFPIENFDTGSKKILYNAFFGLAYAIF